MDFPREIGKMGVFGLVGPFLPPWLWKRGPSHWQMKSAKWRVVHRVETGGDNHGIWVLDPDDVFRPRTPKV